MLRMTELTFIGKIENVRVFPSRFQKVFFAKSQKITSFKPFFCILTVKPDVTQANSFGIETVKLKGGATKSEIKVVLDINVKYLIIFRNLPSFSRRKLPFGSQSINRRANRPLTKKQIIYQPKLTVCILLNV